MGVGNRRGSAEVPAAAAAPKGAPVLMRSIQKGVKRRGGGSGAAAADRAKLRFPRAAMHSRASIAGQGIAIADHMMIVPGSSTLSLMSLCGSTIAPQR